MGKLEAVKFVSGLVVSVGVGAVVSNVVKATTPGNISKLKKVFIFVGGMVLSFMIEDQAVKYTDAKIDAVANDLKNMVKNGELD